MDEAVETALGALLGELGLDGGASGGAVVIEGEEQTDISPHRIGTASALALAANAAGVAAWWRLQTGRGQDVRVEVARATQALHLHAHTRQQGRRLASPRGTTQSFWRTADDRWLHLVTGSARRHQLERTLDALGAPSLAKVAGPIREGKAAELEEAVYAAGAVAAMVRTPEEWRAHPQGQFLATRPVVEIERIGDAPAEAPRPGDRPLSGVRVLDLTHIIAGPMISRTMAEQGADVLHVTPPNHWDPPHFVIDLGVGKRSATADVGLPADVARLHELAGDADVYVQSYRPGSLARKGFSPAELAELRPGLVVVTVSCFGEAGGPWGQRRGVDPIAQAVSGIAHTEGLPGDQPAMNQAQTLNDPLVGYLGAAGAMAGLMARARDGGSYHVRLSLVRCGMWLQDLGLVEWQRRPLPDQRFEHLVTPAMVTMPGPYGVIDYLAPPVAYAETPSRWALPAEPLGASPLTWATT